MTIAAAKSSSLDPSVRKPMREVLEILAIELERLRWLGVRVETAVCQVAVNSPIAPSVVADLQQLDMVLQQLGALRSFVGRLAEEFDVQTQVSIEEALRLVNLSELRARLSGQDEAGPEKADDYEQL